MTDKKDSYELYIEKTISAVQAGDYDDAMRYIKCAVVINQSAPEVHNLLGIIAELKRDFNLAGRHYRASYALDPAYRPASRNLDRITSFFYNVLNTEPDYGDVPYEEIMPYVEEYDKMNARHKGKGKDGLNKLPRKKGGN